MHVCVDTFLGLWFKYVLYTIYIYLHPHLLFYLKTQGTVKCLSSWGLHLGPKSLGAWTIEFSYYSRFWVEVKIYFWTRVDVTEWQLLQTNICRFLIKQCSVQKVWSSLNQLLLWNKSFLVNDLWMSYSQSNSG